jgi:sortase (surface protein transpeptidase)
MWWWKQRQKARTIKIKRKRGVVYNRLPLLSALLLTAAFGLWVLSFLIFTVPIIPRIYYSLNPNTSFSLEGILGRPVASLEQTLVEAGEKVVYQPPFDPNLPQQNSIKIEKIGVDTAIIEESYETHENALRQGVWRVPDLGNPFERDKPTIMAAHRFGYLAWTNEYRRQNSFFNLPKLEAGDKVEVIWNQRKYTYEIYEADEGEDITDYSADLILYTCRFLESNIRIFRYARLVEEPAVGI